MKTTKILCSIILTAALSLAAIGARAQSAGVYPILTGGTTTLPANSTNLDYVYTTIVVGVSTNTAISTNTFGLPGTATNLFQNVGEFDYVGLTWSYGSGSNATVSAYKSFDNGVTYEANPSFSYSGPAASASAFATNAVLDVHGVTTLAFVLKNASTVVLTNDLLEINLKSPKYGAKPATR